MLSIAGPSRLRYSLPFRVFTARQRAMSVRTRSAEQPTSRHSSPKGYSSPQFVSTLRSGLSREGPQRPVTGAINSAYMYSNGDTAAKRAASSANVNSNSLELVNSLEALTVTDPSDRSPDIRNALRTKKGTTFALKRAHKYLFHLRSRTKWKDVYYAQYPEAEYPESNIEVNWKRCAAGDTFTPHIVSGHESHPYVQGFSNLIVAFLAHPFGAAPARSLLARQTAEGVPLTTASAIAVLRHMPISFKSIGTLLPPPIDPVVLAAIIHTAVRRGIPDTAEEYREIIAAALEEGGMPSEPKHWDWRLWGALISAHVNDFRGSLRTLAEFKACVVEERQAAIDSGAPWPDQRARAIDDAYTNVIYHWIHSRARGLRSRDNVNAPALLATDLEVLLRPAGASQATTQSRLLPLQFLTAWLNADQLAGTGHADIIWAQMAGITLHETIDGVKPTRALDGKAHAAFLKMLKTCQPGTYRRLAPNLPFTVYDELVLAIAHHPEPDLPLVRALLDLQAIDMNARFDAAAEALIRSARLFASARTDGKNLLPSPYPPFPRHFDGLDARVSDAEWEWVTQCIGQSVLLPLSKPRAALENWTGTSPENPILVKQATFSYDVATAGKRQGNRLMPTLKRMLSEAIVSQARANGESGTPQEIYTRAMSPIEL